MNWKPLKEMLETVFVWLVSIVVMGVFGFVLYLILQVVSGASQGISPTP